MINFESFQLENGLRVVFNQDKNTTLVAVNLLYEIGAKHEDDDATGFAHLFEHLMFSGSKNYENYDQIVERLGGESNAFTNNDITNYYLSVPNIYLQHALDLEADRMQNLNLNQKSLDVQKSVVIEEFKQRYINQPYGDLWKEIRQLSFTLHPYQHQTIGKCIEHIENVSLERAKQFYENYYTPSNAILAISGNVELSELKTMVENSFGKIPCKKTIKKAYPCEPKQSENRKKTVKADVPANLICIIFQMGGRLSEDYYKYDLISDVLSNGKSTRLYNSLVVNQKLFTEINAFITGEDDCGLFVVTGKYRDGVSIEQGEEAIWKELKSMQENMITENELQKMKNKNDANSTFGNIKALDKAMNLAYFTHLEGKTSLINQEREQYNKVSLEDLQTLANNLFNNTNYSTLYYLKNK
jgi:predicted Zn-dependent peptidase